jgi:hypothetical protein
LGFVVPDSEIYASLYAAQDEINAATDRIAKGILISVVSFLFVVLAVSVAISRRFTSGLVTLAEARQKAQEVRKATRVERRDILAERKDEAAAKVTFRQAAIQNHSENKAGWKSTVYARQWLATLENYAFKKLGDMPTGSITSADVISVLTPIWQEIPDTARQLFPSFQQSTSRMHLTRILTHVRSMMCPMLQR